MVLVLRLLLIAYFEYSSTVLLCVLLHSRLVLSPAAKEEARKLKEMEKMKIAEERELKRLEAAREKERKAEERRKAVEERKKWVCSSLGLGEEVGRS